MYLLRRPLDSFPHRFSSYRQTLGSVRFFLILEAFPTLEALESCFAVWCKLGATSIRVSRSPLSMRFFGCDFSSNLVVASKKSLKIKDFFLFLCMQVYADVLYKCFKIFSTCFLCCGYIF